jgi:autotransporter adhesin
VAIGNGSTSSAANTVSVGSAGNERRVTHVATATSGTDAINLDQLNAALTGINGNLDVAMGYTDQRIAAANAYTDQGVRAAREYAARGIAASSALPSVMPSEPGKTAVGLGSGYHDGETAVGLSVAHSFNNRVLISGGVAKVSGGKNVARMSVGFEF